MQSRNLIIVIAAIVIGLVAVLFVNGVFSNVEKRQEQIAEANKMVRVVVASQDMAFGTPVSGQNVRLVNWPASSVPEGAFTSIDEATRARVALRPIVSGEPILESKVSGANGRATLSANLPAGQLAFSIPISEITGAGGFIRPGDVVDVLVTRKIPGEGAQDTDKMTDVVLEAVPVLGIDQESDQNKTNPAVGKTATLQVDTFGAQKLALAGQLGVLTLALRNVADTTTGGRSTVIGRDISASRYYIPERRSGAAGRATAPLPSYRPPMRNPGSVLQASAPPIGPSMTVVRGTKSSEEGILHGF
jgi:pilus assembly protein CpaB